MLHIPEQMATALPMFAPISTQKGTRRAKPVLIARQLIADYRKAKFDKAIATRTCKALYRKYSELEQSRPLILMGLKNNREVYGRWIGDFDKAFPPQVLKLRRNGKGLRNSFLKAIAKAFPAHRAQRDVAGITFAETQRSNAIGRESRLFCQICAHVPTSRAEAALIAAFILKQLPVYMNAPIFSQKAPATPEEFDELRLRQAASIYFLADMLRSFAKAVEG
jgi:hypothetical protein